MQALREVRKLQMSVDLLIKRAPFRSLVKAMIQDIREDYRMAKSFLLALQYAAEDYMCSLFQRAQRLAIHAKRQTVRPVDMKLAVALMDVNTDTLLNLERPNRAT